MVPTLHVRWLGRVPYREVLAVQETMFSVARSEHLLLVEHPHVFTHGPSADLATNLKCRPEDVGAELVAVRRGGDVTYHGPGQLVGYPILDLPSKAGTDGPADPVAHVHRLEQLIIDTLIDLGLPSVGRMEKYPGVWVEPSGAEPRKICAIGVRVARRRSMHGFALNVDPDLDYMRRHIVPCGISEHPVTSLAEEGIEVTVREVVDALVRNVASLFDPVDPRGPRAIVRHDVAWLHRPDDLSAFSRGEGPGEPMRLRGRLAQAGVTGGVAISERKPDWMRVRVEHGDGVLTLKRSLRDLGLVTVCEEAGCPNLSECWSDGTATLMVLGERCTRACGFCLVDTRKPERPDDDEPRRVAEAVSRMDLDHVVLTMVARDDLDDGGMAHVAACVRAIRDRAAGDGRRVAIETLISDVRGTESLDVLLGERPEVLNHNIETVARLQRAVRPSAGYARSLAVLARAKSVGLTTKSGIIVGMGESDDEVRDTLADLAAVGTDIVTIGQYLRPTSHHLPVVRWVPPETFDDYKSIGESFGISHVEASPLTRSSYHAKQAATAAVATPVTIGAARG